MKVDAIYTLPKWYNPDKYIVSEHGVINLGAQSEQSYYHAREVGKRLDDWIVENIWEGDYKNDDLIGRRLAFLLDLRSKDFKSYQPMANEKDLIYQLQNRRPEIYKSYLKYSKE